MRDVVRVGAVAFLGVLGAIIWYDAASRPRTPTVRVYVAKAATPERSDISDPAELFAVREMPVTDCPKGAVTSDEYIRGRKMRRTLQPDEILTHQDLAPPEEPPR